MDPEAAQLALCIKNINKSIKRTKGAAWVTFTRKRVKSEYKMVWAGKNPDKVRITILKAGYPVETIVSSGDRVSFFSHTGKHDLKTYDKKRNIFQKAVSIPVTLYDLVSLLTGQTPVIDFDRAVFKKNSEGLRYIRLEKKWERVSQKIVLNPDNSVKCYWITNRKKQPLYKVSFNRFKVFDNHTVPMEICITKKSENILLDITKLSINPVIKKEAFSLTPAG